MLCAEVNAKQHRRLRPHPLCDGCLDDPNSVSVGGHGDQKDDTEEEFSFIIIKPSIPPPLFFSNILKVLLFSSCYIQVRQGTSTRHTCLKSATYFKQVIILSNVVELLAHHNKKNEKRTLFELAFNKVEVHNTLQEVRATICGHFIKIYLALLFRVHKYNSICVRMILKFTR